MGIKRERENVRGGKTNSEWRKEREGERETKEQEGEWKE